MKQDPLHRPTPILFYNGSAVLALNKSLLDQQNCWHNVDELLETHWFRLVIYSMIVEIEDPKLLKSLALDLTEIEFKLQELWGFPLDANYHRFWIAPKCTCPKFDNEDGYPYQQIINQTCPLHGTI